MSRTKPIFALAFVIGAAACAGRNAPATQGTLKAFDPAASDPKAVAIVDQMITALGGDANWAKAKEISWTQGIIIDGKLQVVIRHAWDRWNGRHQYANYFIDGAQAVSMHELYGEQAFAYVQPAKGQPAKQMAGDKDKMVGEAKRRFDIDAYQLTMYYKLKDPGVKLAFAEERQAEGAPADAPMKFDVVKVTFDPGVGAGAGDTWYIVIDKETHLPDMVEHVAAGKPDTERGGFKLSDWVESGGLKFAGRRTTLGYTKLDGPTVALDVPPTWAPVGPFEAMQVPSPGEIILVKNVKVSAEPDEDLYVPDIKKFP
jgi:hypothetical protein